MAFSKLVAEQEVLVERDRRQACCRTESTAPHSSAVALAGQHQAVAVGAQDLVGRSLLQPLRYHVERKLALLALLERISDHLCSFSPRDGHAARGASARSICKGLLHLSPIYDGNVSGQDTTVPVLLHLACLSAC